MDALTAEKVYQSVEFRERTLLGILVTMTGGCMDAYSYLTQGKVFATGQTGNGVLFAVHLAQLDAPGVVHYLVPITSFLVGILFSKWAVDRLHHRDHFKMQRFVLYLEIVVFLALCVIPEEVPELAVNSVISFTAAMLFENFRKFGASSAYSSIFCTGNLRSFAENLYEAVAHHRPGAARRAVSYLSIVGAFLLGAVVVAIGSSFMGYRCGWIVSIIAFVATRFITNVRTEVENTRREVEALQRIEEEVEEEIEELEKRDL